MSVLVSPSILSGDFSRLGEEVAVIKKAGGNFVHCDVMDGHFVPNLTFGYKMIADIKKCSDLPLDVHLMIETPEKYLSNYINAGADLLSFHIEATELVAENLKLIRDSGVKSGLAICPDTPVSSLFEFFDLLDFVVVMGVNPGFGGQGFIPATLGKIAELKREIEKQNAKILIELDGGLTGKNAKDIISAGTDILVSGSAFFGAADKSEYINNINRL